MTKKLNGKAVLAVSTIGLLALALAPMVTMAGLPTTVEDPPSTIGGIDDVLAILNTLVTWLFTILMIVAVIFIFYAAFLYLKAGGEPEDVKKANKQLIFSAVAIAVALIAVGVREVVEDLVL